MSQSNDSVTVVHVNNTADEVFVFPMSSSQKRLWFIEEFKPSTVYNLPVALDITGPLHVSALEKSFQEITDRHESLRTTFAQVEEELVQIIHPSLQIQIPVIEAQEEDVVPLIKEEVAKPFDLKKGPLFRAVLIRLNPEKHVLFWNMHHIISDGWSMGVFHKELSTLYAAFSKREHSPLPELALQYVDFSEWHSKWLQEEEANEQLNYWKKQLAGDLPVLQLPTDRPRPVKQTFRGNYQVIDLPHELIHKLEQLGEKESVTMFTLFFAAYSTLLYRYTSQETLLIGTPIAGRNQKETEDLIGFFVNTLVLRLELKDDPTFLDVLQESRKVAYEAFDNQDIPFDKVVEAVQPQRDPGYSPIFQVMFAFQNSPMKPLELEGVTLAPRRVNNETAKFDLILFIEESKQGLQAVFEYNTDLFNDETIARMTLHYVTLLESAVSNPDQKISRMSMLTTSERKRLLTDWNNTTAEYPREKCIQDLFEEQVANTPDAVALKEGGKCLTYAELNHRANQLAHYLQKRGVSSQSMIGLSVERSIEMIIGMLGIIKAGGVYVPLDACYPEERLRFMLEDSNVSLLITQKDMMGRLPFDEDLTLTLDFEWDKISQESTENPVHGLTGEAPVYINYTSGSTGRPKGVVIPHRGVLRLVKNVNYVNLSSEETLLQFAPISFDAATFEIWGSLLNGAQLVIYPYEKASLEELGQVLQRYEISTLWLTAGVFHQMVEYHLEDLQGVRQLLAGGDVISPAHVRKVLDKLDGCCLINGYGPTESTTFTCCYPMDNVEQILKTVPIGRPISNTQVYVLDKSLQLAPVGVPGELYIGGDGLALEYLNRPDLTEERFIPDPFSDDSSSRLYKTGDLVRYLADGNIEFLGRADNQVKIRGFRIELGEIEAVLAQYPHVEDVVVMVHETTSGDKRLVAYVVSAQEHELAVKGLLHYVKDNIPEYMVPHIVVTKESLPLTPNGKVDYKALSALELENKDLTEAYIPPRTNVEEEIALVWSQVLDIRRIGIHDNFFDLGGHSLVATLVVSRLREVFDICLDVRSIFTYPTVATLAVYIEGQKGSKKTFTEGISPVGQRENLPLSFAQQRLWFVDQWQSHTRHLYNIPLVYEMQGRVHVKALKQSLSEMVRRHESLRTTFKDMDGKIVQVIDSYTEFKSTMIDLSNEPKSEREQRAKAILKKEAHYVFDLSQGPLFRVTLIKLEEEKYLLMLNLHHIVSDGWSNKIIMEELSALYESISQGKDSPLEKLPFQYADYAVWQREWLKGDRLEEQMSYWKKQLGGELPILQLPTDRPRQKEMTFQGKLKRFELSRALYRKLKQLSQQSGASLFMTLLAAFKVLLYRYTGQQDLLVGSPIAGRNHEGIEKMIGFFVNTIVFRTNVSSEQTFLELLENVREISLDAYTYQNVPFERLVEELQPDRDASTSPLFQVMFAMLNTSSSSLTLPGLSVTSVELEHDIAKFDLTLNVMESEDRLEVSIEYNSNLFDEETISRMGQHYQAILDGIVDSPEYTIGQIPILTEMEQQKFLTDWNEFNHKADAPDTLAVHFETRVAQSPDAVALIYGNRQLTYREVNKLANQLAYHLRERGVEANQLVGIMAERSLEMVIGIFAILKAGGAYLPIDPHLPEERIQYMLKDSGVKLLLTQEIWQKHVAFAGEVLNLEDEKLYQGDATDLKPLSKLNDLAYVIYTSGSTGKPKGVMVTQRNVLHILYALEQLYPFNESDVYLLKTPFTFDVSVSELFGWIQGGGKLAILEPQAEKDPVRLFEAIKDYQVTHVNFVPSMLHSFLESLKDKLPRKLPALRYVFSAGEALKKETVKTFFELFEGVRLENLYGPTEITIYASHFSVEEMQRESSIPIGKPLPNTKAYVVDENLQLQPLGVPGELCISGLGVTKGYLNREGLTEEKFVPVPWAVDERMYRTGDLVRWLPNGDLEYLGRMDDQVKLRGFRIELGEIQATLESHAAVRESVVVVREDQLQDQRLVAYIVVQPNQALATSELRHFLKRKLPEYMVPSVFVTLDEMPLSPSGKVDRKALPMPKVEGVVSGKYTAPRNPIEEIIAGIWNQVLGVNQVSIQDNFFEIGGHSLLATQVLSRLRIAIGIEVPVHAIFNYPTIAELASHIDTTKQEENEIAIEAVPRGQHLPLSSSQKRLWFLNQMEMENKHVYNIPLALRLQGELDLAVFEESLNEIVRRHEILRTTFVENGEQIEQVISPFKAMSVPFIDLSREPVEERETKANSLIQQEVLYEFDLSQGPLFRASIIRLQPEKYILLLNLHHIIWDGWSHDVFMRELSILYRARLAKEVEKLPELPIQYADFAAWQQGWIESEEVTKQINYWKEQLQGQPPLLPLPTNHQRPSVQTYRGDIYRIEIPERVTALLKNVSKEEGTTLYMTLLAAFKVLLYRYTDQEDLSVGSPVANRNQRTIENLIGYFVNTLVLRTQVAGTMTYRELLKHVREVALEAYAHQDVPFEKLVEELNVERNLSYSPLFQVMFMLQNTSAVEVELPGLEIEDIEIDRPSAKYDLTLFIAEKDDRLTGVFEYNTDLFDEHIIAQMADSFYTLLEGIVAHVEERIDHLPVVSAKEKKKLIIDWNDTKKDYPLEKRMHQFFEEQVKKNPKALAVVFDEEALTYEQLNCRANQLARHLQTQGVKAGTLVGIYMERSLEMLVSLLAVFKSEGVYVPLDPSYPQERVSFMLEDSKTRVILTHQDLATQIPEHGAQVVYVDQDWETISLEPNHNLECYGPNDSLAYTIYTSGSTGKPKGVQIRNDALTNYLLAANEHLELQEQDRFLAVTTISFDIAGMELYLPLMMGACVIIAKREEATNGECLAELLTTSEATVMQATPATWQMLLQAGWEGHRQLKVLTGGEALPLNLANQLLERSAGVWNFYGPTEATIYSTISKVEPGENWVSIGRPIANTSIYVLDRQLNPIPTGVSGELYIGGEGLAAGYLNRPALTRERFVDDPFSDKVNAKMYRTGDLVRYRANGELEFISRIDHQVKIRGFRIELGEIENVLIEHESIKEAVAIEREDVVNDKRLVAYVIADNDKQPNLSSLRSLLKRNLPDYMVPSAIVVMDKFPLTPNGKIDRRELPIPKGTELTGNHEFEAPRTEMEKQLADIWCNILRVNQLSIHDSFFESGGHSLLATQLISRLRKELNVELPLRSLFENPTIAGLAMEVEGLSQAEKPLQLPPIEPRSAEDSPLLSFAQQRLWFLNELDSNSAFYNIPIGFRVTGNLNVSALEKALHDIIRRHEVLRTAFAKVDGEALQQIHLDMNINMTLVEIEHLSDKEQEAQITFFIEQESKKPFDLHTGPLLRLALIRLKSNEHILLLTVHHIVFDVWSMDVFMKELAAYYEAWTQGGKLELPELPVQYADFANWQRQWLQKEVIDKQIDYWKQKLEGAPPALELPTDRPRPPVQTFNGSHETRNLSRSLLKALQKVSYQEDATLFMTMLAAFQVVLYRYTNQQDILIGSPIANRQLSEVEELIGLFTNTLVLRTQITENMSFRELLKQVRITALEAYEHQNLPFEKLVEELQPNRDLSRSPLFQIMLAYQDFTSQEFMMDEVVFEGIDIDNKTSKFDLTLFVQETEYGLATTIEYNTDLFDRATIQRMLGHLERLLEQVIQNPHQSITEIPMLSEREQQLLNDWNDRTSNKKVEQSVHRMFEEQVLKTPYASALQFGEQSLSYCELNNRANQLAHYLRKAGVGKDSPVGICLDRSIETIISVLAILKAGGAVISLDPNFPEERLAFIIGAAQVNLVLSQESLSKQIPALSSAQVICLDQEWQRIDEEKSDNLSRDDTLDSLAYLIYTSGSTGEPKGVAMPHRSLANLIAWQHKNITLTRPMKTLQFTSLSFDVSYQEIFSTLCAGEELVLITEETRRDPVLLLNYLDEKKIERLYLPFIALQQLAEAVVSGQVQAPTHLGEVITAGEQLKVTPSVRYLFKKLNNCTLHNHYGPSETHVITTMALTGNPDDWPLLPSIGYPIDHTQVYILDRHLNPVPIGVPGVMYLAGDCLANGYLNRPDLTEEKFIGNPFRDEPNARMYYSGDLARYRPDGSIEFLGRVDDQVKIRGYRVELGEIESLLAQHPEVQECAVVVREEVPGEQRLAAYVIMTNTDITSDFRQYLKKFLPEYMVPSTFTLLKKMPLTGTGKVDRKSLPAPKKDHLLSTTSYTAPQTELEQTISDVWKEVLGVDKVGLKDNFFDLGGHSLLVVRVCSRLSETLDQAVPTMHMFQYPTVATLANALHQGEREHQGMEEKVDRAKSRKEVQKKQRQRRQQRAQAKKEKRETR
ncbi:non-ribosomal peptide synthase/polyketide synthase [Bacillus fungorum]|uniref:non-ribosomal peptide synthetase n=1 Tax=Bacillus fungorum TaxID=2039284 RepID=UPI003F5439F7